MEPIKKEDIDQKVFDIYDEYVHSKIDRRQFVERLSLYTAGGLTVSALMNFLLPNYVQAKRFGMEDARFDASYIKYDSPKGAGQMKALLTKPNGINEKLPGIVVVHENRGLNPYIEDVAHQCALDGFVAIAPDALTPFGGYPGTDEEGRTLQAKRDRDEMLEDFIAAFEFLKNHPDCNGKIGVVGFCFGGWISNMMAVKLPDLKAAVPYYGGQASADEVPSIQSPIQLHFASLDTRVNAGWDDYKIALEKNEKEYEVYFYEGMNHGFHNHSTPRYDEDGAKLAWERTIRFFREKLV
ncbi:dienelactone hydrolase family protein [Belliella kenyensis]|uniref:Dienelactone hydrolase family protein n=1 Tax=Belliella kenyensis TaxID=1472724 RepID=A0ABV8EKH6_9BACT|nr:dienelactone hydrolase family protein [Belliella kenyensis]MCH7400493.1 dienelactone hydrolase family protein [Belliella kenyensis]MDN3604491.1 dienelactone hydrolase family protein [Belliella kenyensis]